MKCRFYLVGVSVTQTLRALPAWKGARTSPDDIRVGEKQKASAQERAAAAATKQVDLMAWSIRVVRASLHARERVIKAAEHS